MLLTRRRLIESAAAISIAPLLAGCQNSTQSADAGRRYVINANMVIPGDSDLPFDATRKGDIRRTGLTAIKQSIGGSQGTYEQIHEILDIYETVFSANADVFMPVRRSSELQLAYDEKRVGIIHSFETATMLQGKVERIAEFAKRGVRIMQPGYNTTNEFGAGVMSVGGDLGLSSLGKEAITAMEAAQVLVDLSHAHEVTAKDALEISTRPSAMTHTGCYSVNAHPRNKSDSTLRSIAEKGGVVGIYEMSYLTPGLEQQSLEAFMAHLEHAVRICGEDHVGIGSDTPLLRV